jgi:hypothetical protein
MLQELSAMQGVHVFLVVPQKIKSNSSIWLIVGTWITKHVLLSTNWVFEWDQDFPDGLYK